MCKDRSGGESDKDEPLNPSSSAKPVIGSELRSDVSRSMKELEDNPEKKKSSKSKKLDVKKKEADRESQLRDKVIEFMQKFKQTIAQDHESVSKKKLGKFISGEETGVSA